MRIKEISLKNFKRFTDLTIKDIPESAKLVLLIGANGSGKSSVFDAFNKIGSGRVGKAAYYNKGEAKGVSIGIDFHKGFKMNASEGEKEWIFTPTFKQDFKKLFYGRSSIRIVPKIALPNFDKSIEDNEDRPSSFILADTRFKADINEYLSQINNALREPTFKGQSADTVKIFREFIGPFNQSLQNIFGENGKTSISLIEFHDAQQAVPAKFIFRKGESKINYDYLSHGEKQVVVLLLNFVIRNKYYQDTIYYIDEMDTHIETSIQKRLIKEIVEKWIPEGSQLWTASHALGFIEYAKTSSHAEILNFDNLDFDVPQVITPSPKDNPDVYEIAVGKEFLPSLFAGYDFVFVENSDKEVYSQIEMPKTIFIRANDKNDVVHKAGEIDSIYKGVVDRDFLSDDDVAQIKAHYKNIYVLEYYSVENYLYHPDNLEEYCRGKKDFDKQAYINKIVEIKNDRVLNHDLVADIDSARNKYPYFKQQRFNSEKELSKRFKDSDESKVQRAAISQMLKSNDLETFYKVFSMKAYSGSIAERQHISKVDLSKTNWFKTKIKELLA